MEEDCCNSFRDLLVRAFQKSVVCLWPNLSRLYRYIFPVPATFRILQQFADNRGTLSVVVLAFSMATTAAGFYKRRLDFPSETQWLSPLATAQVALVLYVSLSSPESHHTFSCVYKENGKT